jgi:hypothetical protein
MGNYFLKIELIYLICFFCDRALLFTIRLGNNKLSTDDPNMLLLATETYFLHPDYDPVTLSHDIGLIKLRMSIQSTGIILQHLKIRQTIKNNFSIHLCREHYKRWSHP